MKKYDKSDCGRVLELRSAVARIVD